MVEKLQTFFVAPTFPDNAEKTRLSSILNPILWASLVCVAVFGVAGPFAYQPPLMPVVIALVIGLVIVVNLFLLHRGYTRLTSLIFSLMIWVIVTLFAIWTGGIQTDAYTAYFIAILIAGILLGGRAGIAVAILSVLAGLAMMWAEAHDGLPAPVLLPPTPLSTWVSMTILLGMTAVWLSVATRSINSALDKARQSNRQLQAYTQALEQQQGTLAQERDAIRVVENSLRRTTERLTILHQIEQGILAAQSAKEIAAQSLQQIQKLIPCQRISLAIFDFETNEAVFFAIVRREIDQEEINQRLPLSAFSSVEALQQGEHFIMEDMRAVAGLTAVEQKRMEEEGIRSYVNVPLIVRDKLIGSLNLAAAQPNPWQPEHLEIAHEIAGQLAIAVEQTRLLAAAERRANELEALRQISLEFVTELDLDNLLQSIVVRATKILGANRGNLLLHQADSDQLKVVAKQGIGGVPLGYMMQLGLGASGKAWQTGQPQVINNYLAWEGRVKEMEGMVGSVSLISTPVSWHGERFGVLTLGAKLGERFDAADAELLGFFAANAAAAIQNARLHDDVQRYVAQLEQEVIERKQIEQALQEQRDFAEQVMRQMGQGLTLTDADDNFTFVNQAFARILGREPEDLIGVNTRTLNQVETSALEQAIADRKQGKVTSYELRLYREDGEGVDVLVTGVPRWQGNRIAGSIAVITDLTQQKRAEQEREQLIAELEARNAELGRFTYTVSHDLKSPLVTVKGFLGFLARDIARGDTVQAEKDMRRIREATDKMELLLKDLLDLSRIGRISNPPQPVPFNELVEEALALVAGAVAERGVQVEVAPNMPLVWVDRQRLVEVLQNLLDNGVKFMGKQPQPRLEVGWRREAEEVVFFVRDNGSGIEAQFQEQVFGLFERLDTTVEGTGIGLALVQRIVEVHNGRIWIESAGRGLGTTFCFTLGQRKHDEINQN